MAKPIWGESPHIGSENLFIKTNVCPFYVVFYQYLKTRDGKNQVLHINPPQKHYFEGSNQQNKVRLPAWDVEDGTNLSQGAKLS